MSSEAGRAGAPGGPIDPALGNLEVRRPWEAAEGAPLAGRR